MKRRLIDDRHIEQLLSKFMDGQTTIEEEDTLARYFRNGRVRKEWEDYREMFAYFDRGMAPAPPQPHLLRRLWQPVAAAIVAGWIAGAWLMSGSHTTHTHTTTPSPPKEAKGNQQSSSSITPAQTLPLEPAQPLPSIHASASAPKAKLTHAPKPKAAAFPQELPAPDADIIDAGIAANTDEPILLNAQAVSSTPEPLTIEGESPTLLLASREMTDDELLDLQLLLLDRQLRAMEEAAGTLLDVNEQLIDCFYLREETLY